MTMPTANYSLEEMDRQSLIHPATSIADHLKNGPTIIAGGSGVRIKDRRGRELIDCGAGLWCVNIGYGRAELGDAAAEAMRNLGYYHTFGSHSNEPIIRLADRVLSRFREKARAGHLSKMFFAPRARTPTRPISSWCATTTICSAARGRRRSYRGSAAITG
jgi:L-2,4-diaminobutyrate transaminase